MTVDPGTVEPKDKYSRLTDTHKLEREAAVARERAAFRSEWEAFEGEELAGELQVSKIFIKSPAGDMTRMRMEVGGCIGHRTPTYGQPMKMNSSTKDVKVAHGGKVWFEDILSLKAQPLSVSNGLELRPEAIPIVVYAGVVSDKMTPIAAGMLTVTGLTLQSRSKQQTSTLSWMGQHLNRCDAPIQVQAVVRYMAKGDQEQAPPAAPTAPVAPLAPPPLQQPAAAELRCTLVRTPEHVVRVSPGKIRR